jgi:putative FmdB family regulatory protein
MPLFEFVCRSCAEEFEELVFHEGEEVACPKCGKTEVEKKLSRFAFKGSSGKMRTSVGGSCSTCRPGPSGCAGCGG